MWQKQTSSVHKQLPTEELFRIAREERNPSDSAFSLWPAIAHPKTSSVVSDLVSWNGIARRI